MNLPNPNQPALEQALHCARLAEAAYGGGTVPIDAEYKSLQVGADSGFVLVQGNVAAIALKGTKCRQQWAGNLFQDWGVIAQYLKEQADPIIEKLVEDHPTDFYIYFSGHSRGGALAQRMCDKYIRQLKRRNQMQCLTFGTPRSFHDDTELPGVSYCLPFDPVPRIPWHTKGYGDPCTRKYFIDGRCDDEWPWWPIWKCEAACVAMNAVSMAWLAFQCLKGWTPWQTALDDWGWFRHGIGNYVRGLEALQ